MSDLLTWFIGCLTAVAIVATIVGGIIYGTLNHSQMYYDAQKHCIDNGGSWTPVIIGRTDSANFSCQNIKAK